MARGQGDDGDDEPEGGGVYGVPEGFLGGGYARRTEDDKGAGGAGVQKLSEHDAVGVVVDQGDEHPHGGHGSGERQEKREPVRAVGGGSAEVIDDGNVPGSPKQAEKDGGDESVGGAAHFAEGEAHPADFLEETGDEAEGDADEKAVGSKVGGNERFHRNKDRHDQERRDEKYSVPMTGNAYAAHLREEVAQTASSADYSGQQDADRAGPQKHGGKHHQASKFWDGFTAEQMRGGDAKGPEPGDEEGQDKIGEDWMAGDEKWGWGGD